MQQKLYSIGEVSKLCNISMKALRFYHKIGMIVPDEITETGYRYYSEDTMLSIPIVKYYKQMGFRLEEMQDLVNGKDYYVVGDSFQNKIYELWEAEHSIHNSYVAVKEWYELIQEAKAVLRNSVQEVGVRYVVQDRVCYLDQNFCYNYKESIINVSWVNYLDSIKNEISGPVILGFPSWKEKLDGKCTKARIMQKPVRDCIPGTNQGAFGGFMAATLYHVGPLENIHESYAKLKEWQRSKGIHCSDVVYERYVMDYWTTRNRDEFVTEIIVPLKEGQKED